MPTLWRVLGGTIALLLFFAGRGARMIGVESGEPLDYWVGTVSQLLAAGLALLIFVISSRTRLKGPTVARVGTSRHSVGWSYLALAGVILLSAASLFWVASESNSAPSSLAFQVLSSPDIALKMLVALLGAGAGASALAGSEKSALLVRLVAIPLVLIWPLGVMIGFWGAWSTLSDQWRASAGRAAEKGVVTGIG